MFTDNPTVESCVVRGLSSSPKLLELVERLQVLTMRAGIKIHVFHVAGTRMIAQGIDGVSRGYLGHGVMAGQTMSVFILSSGEVAHGFSALDQRVGRKGSQSVGCDELVFAGARRGRLESRRGRCFAADSDARKADSHMGAGTDGNRGGVVRTEKGANQTTMFGAHFR